MAPAILGTREDSFVEDSFFTDQDRSGVGWFGVI